MTPEQLEKYLRQTASYTSLRAAYDYQAVLHEQIDVDIFLYHCQDKRKKPYEIKVKELDNGKLATSCDCPNGRFSLCKHAIAALREHVDTRQEALAARRSQQQPKSDTLSYPIDEHGDIDWRAILDDFHGKQVYRHYFSTADTTLDTFADGVITLKNRDYHQSNRQTFTRSADGRSVELACDCKQKRHRHYCVHLLDALTFLEKRLGADCLHPDYAARRLRDGLARYGLTPDDDYHQWFEQGFDAKGFYLRPTIDGLQPLEVPQSLLSDILGEHPTALQRGVATPEKGIAISFEFDGKDFSGLRMLEGKYDKTGQELSKNFKEIDQYNLSGILESDEHGDHVPVLFHKIVQWHNRLKLIHSKRDNRARQQALVRGAALFAEICTQSAAAGIPLFAHTYKERYSRKSLTPLNIVHDPVDVQFTLDEDESLYHLTAKITIAGKPYALSNRKLRWYGFFLRRDDDIIPIADPLLIADLGQYQATPEMRFLKHGHGDFHERIIKPLSRRHAIHGLKNAAPRKGKKDTTTAKTGIPQVYLNEEDGWITFRLAMQYGEQLINVNNREILLSRDAHGRVHVTARDDEAEAALIARFESLHPHFVKSGDHYLLPPPALVENGWLLDAAAQLHDANIELLGVKNLKDFKYNLSKPSLAMRISSGTDWFDLEIDIRFGEQSVSLKDLQKAFLKKSRYILLNDGSTGILPEDWLTRLTPYLQSGDLKKDRIQLAHSQFAILDDLCDQLENTPAFLLDLRERKKRLQNLHLEADIPVPQSIQAELRPYQRHGLNWLNFLHENRLGGCLADDMGLGKTLQTIAFLAHLKETQPPGKASLIVAPTSLIFNWQQELEKFCPSLTVLTHTGQHRHDHTQHFDNHDLVLTTYGALLRDIDHLQHHPFHYIILDESQAIKNPQSQRYKAARLLKADNRLILTGTPIENNTFDLYAQFSFANPGLLGSAAQFKSRFADSIDKNADQNSAELLAKLIQPFILRRSKAQVAHELPPKVESILYCDMDKNQRKLYEHTKQQYRDQLLAKIDADGIASAQLHILEGLMKLRQICNSPALLRDDADYGDQSAKLDLLLENIRDKTGKHKILVFSSFVKMLRLIETRLQAENIASEYLDGQTRNRREKVENFQENDDVRVFLISTKAGGTGLNLTSADYVFIVDPWWNPAVENQAIDRAYRIGQDKHVMAYRLICKDSIEEKILQLQERKRHIADSIISIDGEQKTFDLKTVKALFS
ncbi:MAG: DEAD/DEAH box helicase [Cardiobacteriaceae bacterium]|nr:DEAD/DEAH box helicase [Cardiobacteriaceae bacterium]